MARAHRNLRIAASLFWFIGNLFLASATTSTLDLSALQSLYGSLNNAPQLTGWNSTGGDPCGSRPWRGVSCSGQSVISIEIGGLGLDGHLNPLLSTLLSLKKLDVSHNNISGEIPHGLPPNATHINVAFNNFNRSIPYALASVKGVSYLNFSYNSLSGPVGNVFTDMKGLETLDLSFNQFSGDLPSSFGLLTKLHALYLQSNWFTGSVTYLAKLPLNDLHLENNHFSGYIPQEFKSIPSLSIGGNLFQPGFVNPSELVNHTTFPLPSPDRNVSHNIKNTSSSFGFSSTETGHNNHNRRLRKGALAGIICGVLLVAIFAMAVFMFLTHRSHKSSHDKYQKTAESFHSRPLTTSTGPAMKLEECIGQSSLITTLRPSSISYIKSPRTSKRKSCSRRSRLVSTKLFSAAELLEATNNYSQGNILGEGSIGRVYKAQFPDGQILAVKKIDMVALSVCEEDEFLDVVWNMSRLRHPGIITLLGYSVEQNEHILVYEYAQNGSLEDALSTSSIALSWKARIRIAVGVVHALEYMHWKCSPQMTHGNIKASNILLDNELMPHISDCGLTVLRHLVSQKNAAKPSGSDGYTAPELDTFGADKTKIDIYSFGVVLLELLTGRKAFESSRRKEEQYLVKWAYNRLHDSSSLEGMVDPAIRGTIPSKVLSGFADIILLCIQPDPRFRFSTNLVAESLVQLICKMDAGGKPSTADEGWMPLNRHSNRPLPTLMRTSSRS